MKSLTKPFGEFIESCLNNVKIQYESLCKLISQKYCIKYKRMYDICVYSFETVLTETYEDASNRLTTLLELEYETIELDFNDSVAGTSDELFFNFIEVIYNRSKDNLKYNLPKIIKHFFIRKSLSKLKETMIKLSIDDDKNDIDLIPEAKEIEKKRKDLIKARDGFKKLKSALKASGEL